MFARREAFLTQQFEKINTGPQHSNQSAASAAPHSTHTRCACSDSRPARGDAGAERQRGSGGGRGQGCAQVTGAVECECAVGLRGGS